MSVPLENLCRSLLESIGEDPSREGLLKTPERFARMIPEITAGYQESGDEIAAGAIFEDSTSEMILVKGIEFYSLCEHHLLPFFGKAHIAYIPKGKILGLSKIPRIVRMFARRLQVQERLTRQIADEISRLIQPLGVACLVEAQHLCTMMRGIEVQSSIMVTNSMSGAFLSNQGTRNEFLNLVK